MRLKTFEAKILSSLQKNELETTSLASQIQENARKVYGACKKLEENYKLISSSMTKSEERLFYCPLIKKVLTSETYDEIMDAIEKNKGNPDARIVPFHPDVRVWKLSSLALGYLQSGKALTSIEFPGDDVVPPPTVNKKGPKKRITRKLYQKGE